MLWTLALLLAACHGPKDTIDEGPAPTTPGQDTTVALFDDAHVFFTGDTNNRQLDAQATLPAADQGFASLTLRMSLTCPGAGCDAWDRWGFLGVVVDAGTPDERVVELTRFITPYGVGFDWTLDVTDLRPLLTGTVDLRLFIDTWVGPGSGYGDGWQVNADLDLVGGAPPRDVRAALPVWGPTGVVYGDPARPTAESLVPADVALPAGTQSVGLRALVTGHGQGNADNCAEFCPVEHTLTVAGTESSDRLWRDNCDRTAAPGQQGNYRPARAGWCPGAEVKPWAFEQASAGASATVAWSVEDFVNTCRPDSEECGGCVFGTPCEYDGGMHTEPFHQVSAVLIAYGDAP